MNTAEQKAEELIEKFEKALPAVSAGNVYKREKAIEVSLICVEEILVAINDMEDQTIFINGQWHDATDIYNEVKQYLLTKK